MFDGFKTQIPGMLSQIDAIGAEDATVHGSATGTGSPLGGIGGLPDVSGVFDKLKNVVTGFGGTGLTDVVRTNPMAKIAKLNSLVDTDGIMREIKDVTSAAKANLDFFKGKNPASVLDSLAPEFSAAGKSAMDSMKSVVESADLKGLAKDIRTDARKMGRQLDKYFTGALDKADLQGTLDSLQPKVDELVNTSADMLDQLKELKAPADAAMGSLINSFKDAGFDKAAESMKKGDFESALTMTFDAAMKSADTIAKSSELASLVGEAGGDIQKLQDHVKTLDNQMKASMKGVENSANNFLVRAKRIVNQSNVRDTITKRFDLIVKDFKKEVDKLDKK
jgi:methyl-accepting chemotaxis protein